MLKNNCFLFSLWVLISGALYYMTVTVLISQPGAGWYSHSPPVTLVQYSTVSAPAIINWSGFNYPLLFPGQPRLQARNRNNNNNWNRNNVCFLCLQCHVWCDPASRSPKHWPGDTQHWATWHVTRDTPGTRPAADTTPRIMGTRNHVALGQGPVIIHSKHPHPGHSGDIIIPWHYAFK